jgi:hypothetical protein
MLQKAYGAKEIKLPTFLNFGTRFRQPVSFVLLGKGLSCPLVRKQN